MTSVQSNCPVVYLISFKEWSLSQMMCLFLCNKMKNKKYYSVWTIPESNIKCDTLTHKNTWPVTFLAWNRHPNQMLQG